MLDTNIIKWLRNPYNNHPKTIKALEIYQSIYDGINEAIIIPPIILEIYYKLSESDDENYAKAFIETLLQTPNFFVVPLTRDIGLFAGHLYFKYNILPKKANPSLKDVPGSIDCLLAASNNFIDNSVICTDDGDIKKMSEIKSDFLGIITN